MMLQVPFYKQEADYDCGPTALKMVLDFLDNKIYSKEVLQNLVDSDKSGSTWTLGLAKASAELGFKSEFYSSSLGFNPENYKLEYYQTVADEASIAKQKIDKLEKESANLGVLMQKKELSIKEILSKINQDCTAIILLDWSKIKGTDKFQGHFVPIVGYDEKNIYVHNQGALNPMANFPIERDLFEKARTANGTDQDIVFIYRKI